MCASRRVARIVIRAFALAALLIGGAALRGVTSAAAATGPILAGTTANATSLSGAAYLAVSGNYAYTLGFYAGTLTVVDISNPSAPQVVGQSLFASSLLNGSHLVVSGSYAYVVSQNRNGPSGTGSNDDGTGNSLTILDISNPTAPTIVGSLHDSTTMFGPHGVAVSGSYVYVAAQGCLSGQPCPNASVGDAFVVIDASNPSQPRIVASIRNANLPSPWTGTGALKHACSITISGNYAYVTASYTGRLTTIDISDPLHPAIVSSLPSLPLPVDVAVANGYAYIANENSTGPVTVVDVRSPTSPVVAGSVSNSTLNGAYRIRVRGNFAYVAATYATAMAVIDISNPANPRLVSSFTSSTLLNRTVGIDLDPSAQYVISSSPWLSTETRTLYPPFPLQPGGPTATGTVNIITLDPSPIGVTISSHPASTTTATTATFAFSASDAVSSMRCQLDGAPAALCTTPTSQSYSSLLPGTHTFTVQALDSANRLAAAGFSWTITTQPPANTKRPQITGTVAVGQQLQASPGTWTGSPAPTFSYQWKDCDSSGNNCSPISGATGSSYTVTSSDVGSTLLVSVTATNSAGSSSANSPATSVVSQPAQAPSNSQPPQITGTVAVGQQLQASPGTWTGSPAPTFSYQWKDCDSSGNNCSPISGATGSSYTVTSSDVGSTLLVSVTATNSAGSSSANSPATVVVPPASLAPKTPVLDNFNRANGSVGANWTVMKFGWFAAMNISAGVAVNAASSLYAWDYWNAASFGPDVEAYATVASYSGNDVIRIGARVTVTGTSYSGYFVSISATGVWSIIRIDNGGNPVTLATGPTDPISSGDQIAIRIVGSVVTALHNTATGWKQVVSYNTAGDATRYTSAGRLALEFRYSTIDNFGGGGI